MAGSAIDNRPDAIGLDAMLAKVGGEIGVSPWIRIDQAMIDVFADVIDDHQFIHIDPDRTKAETPFDGTIAHGFLVLSLLSKMYYEAVPPIEGSAMGINYGFDKIRFLSPVPSGARVRGRFRLEEVDERKPGELTFRFAVSIELYGAHRPALVADWLSRLYVTG